MGFSRWTPLFPPARGIGNAAKLIGVGDNMEPFLTRGPMYEGVDEH